MMKERLKRGLLIKESKYSKMTLNYDYQKTKKQYKIRAYFGLLGNYCDY